MRQRWTPQSEAAAYFINNISASDCTAEVRLHFLTLVCDLNGHNVIQRLSEAGMLWPKNQLLSLEAVMSGGKGSKA